MLEGKKGIKHIMIIKEEINCLYCRWHDYIENPKESTKPLLKLIFDFIKVTEYNININN